MISIIGGTGPEGKGLALRFALAGEQVIIGSRAIERAMETAESLAGFTPSKLINGMVNRDAAQKADIIIIAVPYEGQRQTMESLSGCLAGKVVVCVVAPLAFRKGQAEAAPVPEGSAALQVQALAPGSLVAAAFQTVSAHDLLAIDRPVDSDIIVCADNDQAKSTVFRLVNIIPGARAVNGGGLNNARYVEGITPLLLNINKIYKAHSAIKIAGI